MSNYELCELISEPHHSERLYTGTVFHVLNGPNIHGSVHCIYTHLEYQKKDGRATHRSPFSTPRPLGRVQHDMAHTGK